MRVFFIFMLLCQFAKADNLFEPYIYRCTENITKTVNIEIPPDIASHNNILNNYDPNELQHKNITIIQGRLLDAACVPISGAYIYVWPVNMNTKPSKNKDVMAQIIAINNSKNSASAVSNNMGFFTIVTSNLNSVNKFVLALDHQEFESRQLDITMGMLKNRQINSIFPHIKSQANIAYYNINIQLDHLNAYKEF